MKLPASPRALPALAFPLLALVSPRPATACSLVGNDDHRLEATYSSDTTQPSQVMASSEIFRHAEEDSGCSNGVSSCGDIASIQITVTATDDAAPADRLGYQVRVAGGDPPAGLRLPAQAVDPYQDELYFYFDYRDDSGFRFDLELRAVDLNGNVGPPSVVEITEPARDTSAGCSTPRAPGAALTLLSLLWVSRRRR